MRKTTTDWSYVVNIKPQFCLRDRMYRIYPKDWACLGLSGRVDPQTTCVKCDCFGGFTDNDEILCTQDWREPIKPVNYEKDTKE